jgi:hypothetical protein
MPLFSRLMSFGRSLFLAGAFLAVLMTGGARAEHAPSPDLSFEQGGRLSPRWTTEGVVTLGVPGVLQLERDPALLPPTRAESEKFPITPGVWELSGAYASKLHSPDVSFNVSITLKSFDAAGRFLKERRLLSVAGKTARTHFKERLDVPAGAASATVEIAFNKTHGQFRIEGLALAYVGTSIPQEGGDRRAIFKTNRVGNLFYPGDSVRFELQVETPAELSGEKLRVGWTVTDFYRAPEAAPQETRLAPAGKTAKGWNLYRGVLDLSQLPLRVGPYYEVHTAMDLGAPTAAEDVASFAILPEPATKDLDPLSTPFGAHTWNATVYEYFPLAARLGIRRCLVFWSWPEQAPYTPDFDQGQDHLSRIAWPRRFGLAPYGVLYPTMGIEHQEGPAYSDEALREGVRQSIEKYRKDGLWGFQIGNEPPSSNPAWVKRDVATYKVIYEAAKKADPNFVVIGSAIGPDEAFFKAGFQPYQDVYNLHAYSDLGEMRHDMQKYRELFEKYGGKKPIWSTEMGSKSQGLPRDVIARDIVRKAVCFFADGGGFFTWFAVGGMPDPDGEQTGSYADSMDLFASRYNMHLPRLDAVAFYHLINTLTTKTFVAEKTYANGAHGFLFRDTQGNALMIFWSENGGRDVFVPLPGVHEVALTWMNGNARRLEAEGKGINLRLGDDPVFVGFRDNATALPADLPPAAVTLTALPQVLTQGGVAEIAVRTAAASAPRLSGPALWKIDAPIVGRGEDGTFTYRITVPEDTVARAATFTLSDETPTEQGNTELRFVLPVKSRIELDLQPVAGVAEGDSAVRLRVENHSDKPQSVTWRADIIDELPMAEGTYSLADTRPSSAFFAGVANDKLTLAPREAKEFVLPLGGTDRLTLYKLRASVTDTNGNTVQRERRVGGFARVVRTKTRIVLDGNLDEPVWRDAPVYKLDELRQFCAVIKDAKPWAGLQDLSGIARFAWDADNLYLAVEVTDDVFSNPKADDLLWSQDGLQFLIDPFRGEAQSLGRYDYSLGLGQKGLQAWCHMSADPGAPAGLAPEIAFTVRPTSKVKGNRIYEIAIPWSRLAPFRPKTGADLGLTMVINEDDGAGRKSTLGWFGGVHLKESDFVGDLILTE